MVEGAHIPKAKERQVVFSMKDSRVFVILVHEKHTEKQGALTRIGVCLLGDKIH